MLRGVIQWEKAAEVIDRFGRLRVVTWALADMQRRNAEGARFDSESVELAALMCFLEGNPLQAPHDTAAGSKGGAA